MPGPRKQASKESCSRYNTGISVVETIGFRVIFPETDTVFCQTGMVGVPGRGVRARYGAGSDALSEDTPWSEDDLPATGVEGILR